jgi:hypothetical protein
LLKSLFGDVIVDFKLTLLSILCGESERYSAVLGERLLTSSDSKGMSADEDRFSRVVSITVSPNFENMEPDTVVRGLLNLRSQWDVRVEGLFDDPSRRSAFFEMQHRAGAFTEGDDSSREVVRSSSTGDQVDHAAVQSPKFLLKRVSCVAI